MGRAASNVKTVPGEPSVRRAVSGASCSRPAMGLNAFPEARVYELSNVTTSAFALARGPCLDERALIARVLTGDRAAGRELYDAHAPRVYRLVFRLTGDADLAEEFTQETFIRAFRQLDRFRGDAALSTWLYRVAMSVTSNGMRKVKRFRKRETDLVEAEPIEACGHGIEPDLRARLSRAIDELPEIYRTMVVMHDIEGYTHAEISGALGVPEGTCKTRLAHARVRLREALADFGEQ
jgi:RNA polymerase sigma-70 factor (ECF subfamily)